jgi:hypothetical protein
MVFTAMSVLQGSEKPSFGASEGLATGLLKNGIECPLRGKLAERSHHRFTHNPLMPQFLQIGKGLGQ